MAARRRRRDGRVGDVGVDLSDGKTCKIVAVEGSGAPKTAVGPKFARR